MKTKTKESELTFSEWMIYIYNEVKKQKND